MKKTNSPFPKVPDRPRAGRVHVAGGHCHDRDRRHHGGFLRPVRRHERHPQHRPRLSAAEPLRRHPHHGVHDGGLQEARCHPVEFSDHLQRLCGLRQYHDETRKATRAFPTMALTRFSATSMSGSTLPGWRRMTGPVTAPEMLKVTIRRGDQTVTALFTR